MVLPYVGGHASFGCYVQRYPVYYAVALLVNHHLGVVPLHLLGRDSQVVLVEVFADDLLEVRVYSDLGVCLLTLSLLPLSPQLLQQSFNVLGSSDWLLRGCVGWVGEV